ncbi:MAG: hypothetical protein V1717_03705 [Candidatus Micrarchaeota archaeon]
MVWRKILGFFRQVQPPKVIISGLKRENKMFQESIQEEANAFLGKASKLLDDVEGITIHVKTSGRGNATKFELHSLLSLKKATIRAQAAGRKLNLVLQNLFDELLYEARKQKSFRDAGKRKKREG